MQRLLGLALLVSLVLLAPVGCRKAPPKQDPISGDVVLSLPDSAKPPEYAPERVSILMVDGKDFSEPRGTKRTLKLEPLAGKDTVTIEYSFWPQSYTMTKRTKVVKLLKDKSVEVDFAIEDPETPDKIKPIYVPTPYAVVEEMCKLAKVGPDDVVHDIGCGDGRLVVLAVKKFGAKKGVGVDIEEHLVKKSQENAKKEGVADKTEFRVQDALDIKDFSDASVVLLYVGRDLNLKLMPVLKATLKPGSRIVSHRFEIGTWEPDETKIITAKNNSDEAEEYKLLLWTIK